MKDCLNRLRRCFGLRAGTEPRSKTKAAPQTHNTTLRDSVWPFRRHVNASTLNSTIEKTITDLAARLKGLSETPRLDAEVLAMHVTGLNRAQLLAHGGRALTAEQSARLAALAGRRAAGEPIAHITGSREFWSLDLEVTPDTLIPRPETELLVERALARIPGDAHCRVADLGTGTGAVAIAIALERPNCEVVAVDTSAAALEVAARNAACHGASNVLLRRGDWLAAAAGERFDVIVSNPPYVAAGDPHLTRGDLRFEPRSALAAGADGLDAIRAITAEAAGHLEPGGWLLLEHGYDQAEAVGALMRGAGMSDVACYRDYAGVERVTEGRMKAEI
jgi:release factor glutamine methyltransferase